MMPIDDWHTQVFYTTKSVLLKNKFRPLSLDELVLEVQKEDKRYRSLDIKIVALSMVNNGIAIMDNDWKITLK